MFACLSVLYLQHVQMCFFNIDGCIVWSTTKYFVAVDFRPCEQEYRRYSSFDVGKGLAERGRVKTENKYSVSPTNER